ncbi:hypothetical protein LCGC14_1476580 [marine sediment metagenome]|uniref:Uncharacterized protein n=1 Tax=marine sediment metagenome TaxID=412755 RepID=A0A0F9JBI1_9ZZZZ
MKLIVSRQDNEYYVYIESEKHFKAIEKKTKKEGGRKDMIKLDAKDLEDKCWLESYGDNFYFVFDIKNPMRT